jgi:nitroreductase
VHMKPLFDYHNASRHSLDAFAAGPGRLDWATQPDPFRRYAGARLVMLEQVALAEEPGYDAIFLTDRFPAPARLDHHGLSQLFFDSLAVSAWKSSGANRWALRVNASSGNLHPTEAYLVCGPVAGLCERPMVAHYAPKRHALEVRAEFAPDLWERLTAGFPPGTFLVGLTSIHWREAWKYGLRAYRYCMHDAGHALCAVTVAAAGLGWHARLLDAVGSDELACLLGTAQAQAGEPEEPDLLIACMPRAPDSLPTPPADVLREFATLDWQGVANVLSPAHVDWGVEAVAALTRKPHGRSARGAGTEVLSAWQGAPRALSLRRIIRQRRSAVAMDGKTRMSREAFYRLLERTLAVTGRVPFSVLPWPPYLHLVVLVHRVDGVAPGLYLLLRDPARRALLERSITQADTWQRPPECPDILPLFCLLQRDTRAAARAIACHQEIASDGCFSVAMLAEFRAPLERYGAWMYPRLYWEAGMIGQLLYLEAEAAGLRATGIGCFFDDPMHEVLGLQGQEFQDLYHFAVGGAVDDARLTTLPAYG